MIEAETESVEQEFAAPEQEVSEEQEQTEQDAAPVESDKDKNFRLLRESNEQLIRRDEEREKILFRMQKQMLEHTEQKNLAPAAATEPDELDGIDPNDWLTLEQSRKLTRKEIRQEFEKLEREKYQREAPQRVKSRLSDFDSIVTTENVLKLKAQEPEIFKALGMIGDEEAQAVAAYKYIKAYFPGEAPQTESEKRIQDNANRPKSLSSSKGASPLSQANAFENGLTPALKAHLLAEMNACARRY